MCLSGFIQTNTANLSIIVPYMISLLAWPIEAVQSVFPEMWQKRKVGTWKIDDLHLTVTLIR